MKILDFPDVEKQKSLARKNQCASNQVTNYYVPSKKCSGISLLLYNIDFRNR